MELDVLKTAIWQQFGASIKMLENSIRACSDEVWSDSKHEPQCWYLAYHTVFWLDFYLSDKEEGFTPPEPFNLDEMDPAGLLPDRVYSKEEMLTYLEHGRDKCRESINNLTDSRAHQRCEFKSPDVNVVELYFYNMRHVQHAAAQLSKAIRMAAGDTPRWVKTAE